jgi:hypothetical protein
LRVADCRALAEKALAQDSADDVRTLLASFVPARISEEATP